MTKSRSAGWAGNGIVLSAVLAAGLAIGWGDPASADPITCSSTHNGGVHVLTGDLICGASGITLQNGAELDLDGFTVTCTGSFQCIRLVNGGEVHSGNVVSANGIGVFLQSGTGNHVHDVNVTGASTGIAVRNTSSDGFIVDNFVTQSTGNGITTSTGGGNEIVGNEVPHSALTGIVIVSEGNLISGNTANNNGTNGIVIVAEGDVPAAVENVR